MKRSIVMSAGVALALAVLPSLKAEVLFEATGPVTEKTPGMAFGKHEFNRERTRCSFKRLPMADETVGCLATRRLKLPNKVPGEGQYFKFSYDAKYVFTPGPGRQSQRCNQGVFFYGAQGEVLPDCYDTMYPDAGGYHYERVLYAWDEAVEIELFFQKPWGMSEKNGDRCTLEVANIKIETATWEDAAAYCDRTYAKLPPLAFKPEGDCTTLLPRTMDALRTGKPWRVVMLGDSIQQDTFHSQFHALVKRAYPQSNVQWILSMRGGTGCWYYVLAENFFPYIVDHKPDLLVIGGVSNYHVHSDKPNGRDVGPTGSDAMVRVAKLARERLGCEVLIINSPLHVDYRPHDNGDTAEGNPLPKMGFGNRQIALAEGMASGYSELRRMCATEKIQWWDAYVPCYQWLFASGLPWGYYSRDYVHSGELGKQIIGRLMEAYFTSSQSQR